mmetsp:Transcript_79329/g.224561  ORF Transcript_79329/g.224561 Transcript_79329/m.224561 type:complete len:262 (-) Transcript_79329:236-1021(-)
MLARVTVGRGTLLHSAEGHVADIQGAYLEVGVEGRAVVVGLALVLVVQPDLAGRGQDRVGAAGVLPDHLAVQVRDAHGQGHHDHHDRVLAVVRRQVDAELQRGVLAGVQERLPQRLDDAADGHVLALVLACLLPQGRGELALDVPEPGVLLWQPAAEERHPRALGGGRAVVEPGGPRACDRRAPQRRRGELRRRCLPRQAVAAAAAPTVPRRWGSAVIVGPCRGPPARERLLRPRLAVAGGVGARVAGPCTFCAELALNPP